MDILDTLTDPASILKRVLKVFDYLLLSQAATLQPGEDPIITNTSNVIVRQLNNFCALFPAGLLRAFDRNPSACTPVATHSLLTLSPL